MKLTLNNFVVNRVLSDPATLTKYTHGLCKVPSGNFEKKFKEEMRILTLRRLLTLIIFLDRAREANILDKLPRLFVKSAKVKSTSEVLITLCRDFLSAEGNIIKHLSRIGLTVSYKQSPIDEIDYTIQNLATDLRDGVRLGRMTEILTCREPKSILSMLRLPAVSRLQKLHNVGSVLEILRKDGVTSAGDIAPHHIVDGHREMVLKLMWSVLAHFGLRSLLNAESIQQEILSVIRANATRRPRWKLGLGSAMPDTVAPQNLVDDGQEDFFRSLLLRWCNSVCCCFGRTVSNFTTSFADGTVLCLLIHYYHPGLLPLARISSTTMHLTLEERSNAENYAEALQRESQNFELAKATMSDLGGIPKMILIANSENPPEEKAMFLSVAYLCSRLMESSQEILACIRIQNCYCRYKRRIELAQKLVAASLILKCWREKKNQYFLNQVRIFKGPILVIERFLLSMRHQLLKMRQKRLREEKRVQAVTLIQVRSRGLPAIVQLISFLRFAHRLALFRRTLGELIVFDGFSHSWRRTERH
jgi:abnormal spindle-like microcephaly-associated protein